MQVQQGSLHIETACRACCEYGVLRRLTRLLLLLRTTSWHACRNVASKAKGLVRDFGVTALAPRMPVIRRSETAASQAARRKSCSRMVVLSGRIAVRARCGRLVLMTITLLAAAGAARGATL